MASVLTEGSVRTQVPIGDEPFHEWTFPDGNCWTQFYRVAEGYLLRFPGLADFVVSADGLNILVTPVPGVSPQTIEHLYLNQVSPLALSRRHTMVLHAASIEIGECAVAFLGVSGRGKSTLAASFSRSGYRFLADDGLQLDQRGSSYFALPGHPSLRLWEDSRVEVLPANAELALPLDYTAKSRLLAGDDLSHCDRALPLGELYFLGEGNVDKLSIEPVSGRDAVVELVRHSFLLDIEEREMLQAHFHRLIEMGRLLKCFRLEYPRRYEALPAVQEAIVRHASGQRAIELAA